MLQLVPGWLVPPVPLTGGWLPAGHVSPDGHGVVLTHHGTGRRVGSGRFCCRHEGVASCTEG
jgi:hypothetical protein